MWDKYKLVTIFPLQGVYMMAWPTYSDVNNSEHNTTYPQALPAVAQYPSAYAPVSNQLGIAMQPVAIGMQQSYTRATIYPVSGAVPPQGVVQHPVNDDPISAPKQE